MPLPNPDEYANALQNLAQTVADDELREGRLALTPLGLPMLWSGGFADVYRVQCPRTGNTWAVKCFTREIPAREDRYRQIAAHLEQASLPFTMEFKYLQRGVLVAGTWYPIVKMRWVDGHLLNEFVEGHLDQPQRLRQFLRLWVKMADRLRAAETAHADLQHGNVLLVPVRDGQLALRLIDYDGMYVPTLARVRSGESGHAAYQHPQRLRQGTYNGEVDRFPQLAIYCAIHYVATEGPQLWERFNNGDNLLFREQDFLEPAESDLFRMLWELRSKHSRALAGRLVLACNAPLEHTPLLGEVVDGRRARPLTPDEEAAVCEVLQVAERRFIPAAGDPTSSPLRQDLATRSDGIGTASESQTDWGLSDAPDPQATGGQWYIMVADEIVGPVNGDDLKRLVQEGSVEPATLVRQPAGGQWLQAGVIRGLFETSQSSEAAQVPTEPSPSPTPEPANVEPPRPDPEQWHFLLADQIVGPVSGDDLKRLAREGSVKPATLVRQPTGKGWVPARTIQGLLEPSQSSEVGQPLPEEAAPRSGSAPDGIAQVQRTMAELPAAITNSIGMKLALIPAGEFMMGSPDSEKGSATEGPRHLVRITKPFYLGVYEVTQAEYERVMGTNPSVGWLGWLFGPAPDPRKPVDRVSWADAMEFCRRLGQQEGRTYRLPTEAEWEYACRAGTTTAFHFGSELDGTQANCDGRYPYGTTIPGPYLETTVSVGSYPANAFGLYDMHGNVCEWCSDCFDAKYYSQSPVDDPPGTTAGVSGVVRGGSWYRSPQFCRSASRDWSLSNTGYSGTGFRVVRVPAAGDERGSPPAAQSVTFTELTTTPLEEIDWQAPWRHVKTASRSALRSTWRALRALDRGLALLAGEDNVILHGFVRILALVIAAVLVILLFSAIGIGPFAGQSTVAERPLRLVPIAEQTVEFGKPFELDVSIEDVEHWGDLLRFSVGPGAPSGARIHGTTGVFTWTPTEEHEPGTYDVGISVEGPAGQAAQTSFAIVVTRPLRLQPIGEQRVLADETASLTLFPAEAEHWRGSLRFSLDPGAPSGARIDGTTGVFTWTPTEEQESGTYHIAISAEGPDGQEAQTSFAIVVARPLRLQPIAEQRVVAGSPVRLTVLAEEADQWRGRVRFALDSEATSGAAIDAESGVFTWTPHEDHEPGTYNVGISAEGPEGQAVQTSFAIVVARPLRLQPIGEQRVVAGRTARLTLLPEDAEHWGDSLRFTLGPGAPSGARIDGTTGVFTWAPDEDHEPRTYNVGISVEGPEGQAAQTSFAIVVTRPPLEKEITIDLGGGATLEMVLIRAGQFLMGSPDGEGRPDEQRQHRVRITKPFYLGKYPVTQQQWEAVMGSNPSHFKGANYPVENVSWNDCQHFLTRLNERAGDGRREFRLPTEAQWEYACRAGTTTRYSFGDDADPLGRYAWYRENSRKSSRPVGRKHPNAWGLYDMHGNVWEWCADWYESGYYRNSPVHDPVGRWGSSRVFRGGSWDDAAEDCRSATRGKSMQGKGRSATRGSSMRGRGRPDERNNDLGFRLALFLAE